MVCRTATGSWTSLLPLIQRISSQMNHFYTQHRLIKIKITLAQYLGFIKFYCNASKSDKPINSRWRKTDNMNYIPSTKVGFKLQLHRGLDSFDQCLSKTGEKKLNKIKMPAKQLLYKISVLLLLIRKKNNYFFTKKPTEESAIFPYFTCIIIHRNTFLRNNFV